MPYKTPKSMAIIREREADEPKPLMLAESRWRARWKAIAKYYRALYFHPVTADCPQVGQLAQVTNFCPNCETTERRNAELNAVIAAFAAQRVGEVEQRREMRGRIVELEAALTKSNDQRLELVGQNLRLRDMLITEKPHVVIEDGQITITSSTTITADKAEGIPAKMEFIDRARVANGIAKLRAEMAKAEADIARVCVDRPGDDYSEGRRDTYGVVLANLDALAASLTTEPEPAEYQRTGGDGEC